MFRLVKCIRARSGKGSGFLPVILGVGLMLAGCGRFNEYLGRPMIIDASQRQMAYRQGGGNYPPGSALKSGQGDPGSSDERIKRLSVNNQEEQSPGGGQYEAAESEQRQVRPADQQGVKTYGDEGKTYGDEGRTYDAEAAVITPPAVTKVRVTEMGVPAGVNTESTVAVSLKSGENKGGTEVGARAGARELPVVKESLVEPVRSSEPTQPAVSMQPAVLSEPVQPAVSSEPMQPAVSMQPVEGNFAVSGIEGAISSLESFVREHPDDIEAKLALYYLGLSRGDKGKVLEGVKADNANRMLEALNNVHGQVAAQADLQIVEAKICAKVEGFGRYQEIGEEELRAGKGRQAVIYCELENFACKRDAEGKYLSETWVEISLMREKDYQVLAQRSADVPDTPCYSQRRDFFLGVPLQLPELEPGQYRITVKMEDKIAGKLARPKHIYFEVKAGAAASR